MSTAPPAPDQPPPSDFLSVQDVEDAEDILFAHPPMRVVTVVCTCGEAYPCRDVRWARLVKQVAEAGR